MICRQAVRRALALAALLAGGTAQAVDIEPLHVDLRLEGMPFEGEGCEGGDWTLTWQGELAGETNNISDLLISYSSFDSTHESEPDLPAPRIQVKPITCRDKDGNISLRATMSGAADDVRGVVALKQDPGIPSPFFDFSVGNTGSCRITSQTFNQTLENTLMQVRAPLLATLVPELNITREELQKGFTRRFSIEGQLLTSSPLCMGTPLKRGEVTLSYKSNDKQPSIGLSGCAHLPRNVSTTVTAKVDPPGGSLKFTADPAATFGLQPQGTSVTVTGNAPGRATLKGEYTYNGKTATATLAGSSVELVSVNSGQALPKLGLLGVDGKPTSRVYTFPFQSNPGEAGDLLIFKAENEALASVIAQRSSVGIQPVREGRTRIQARTTCGHPVGSPFEVEIVTCDDDVRSELQRRQDELTRREKEIVKRITQLTADPEFQRAATEIKDNTINLAVKTSELIAATLTGSQATAVRNGTASGLSLTQIETAQNLWSVAGIINDGASGNANSAIVSTYALYLNSWSASALKAAIEAGLASQQLAQDLGTLAGVVEQLEDLEPRHDAIRRELYDVVRRANQCDKLPPPPPLPPRKDPLPPKPPRPQPTPRPVPPPVEIPPEVPPPPTSEPTPPTPPPVEQPPIIDPPNPVGGAALCVRRADEAMTTSSLQEVIRAANEYRTVSQRAQEVFENFKASLRQMEQANDEAQRAAAFEAFGPSYNAAMQSYFELGEASRKQEQRFELCTEALPDQPGAIQERMP